MSEEAGSDGWCAVHVIKTKTKKLEQTEWDLSDVEWDLLDLRSERWKKMGFKNDARVWLVWDNNNVLSE